MRTFKSTLHFSHIVGLRLYRVIFLKKSVHLDINKIEKNEFSLCVVVLSFLRGVILGFK